jgi:hypothetical protein
LIRRTIATSALLLASGMLLSGCAGEVRDAREGSYSSSYLVGKLEEVTGASCKEVQSSNEDRKHYLECSGGRATASIFRDAATTDRAVKLLDESLRDQDGDYVVVTSHNVMVAVESEYVDPMRDALDGEIVTVGQ